VNGAPAPSWRQRLFGPLLVLVGLNALVLLVYTLPRTLEASSLAQNKEALMRDVERQRRGVARLKERAETIHLNNRDLDRFYKEVVTNVSIDRVLQDLDKTARAKGTSYAYDDVKGLPIRRVRLSLPFTGSYPQLVAFLTRLEAFQHFVTVDQIQLQDTDAGASLDVDVSAYFRSERPAGAEAKAEPRAR
jgi:Tfp pilus assembly protein PilO